MYYYHIITRNSSELISRRFYAQKRKPIKDDWWLTVKKDLVDLNINLTEEQMKMMKKE